MISSIAGSLASSWTASLVAKLDTASNGYIDTASLIRQARRATPSANTGVRRTQTREHEGVAARPAAAAHGVNGGKSRRRPLPDATTVG